jgi:biopolymer transport protein ExbD
MLGSDNGAGNPKTERDNQVKIKRRARRGFLESSAMSDIAFLLIIYFIVIAGFNVNKGFLMNLPAKNSTRLILKDDLVRFELDDAGNIIHAGAALTPQDTREQIRLAVSVRPNLAVVLAISPQAPWQAVVIFVEMAQSLHVDSFSFGMKQGI